MTLNGLDLITSLKRLYLNRTMDTIIFHKIDTTNYSVRDIEQGFYDRITLSVAYEFTKGSYHQFAKMSDDSVLFDHDLINISNSSSSDFTAKEFTFIGIIFNGKEINNIKQLDKSTYFFDRSKATYPEIDVEKGINNFTFEFKRELLNIQIRETLIGKENKATLTLVICNCYNWNYNILLDKLVILA